VTIVDSKVVISVDAETDAARRQMELLRAHQQAFAAEVMKGLDAQNQKLADSATKWLKVGAAIGSLGVAAKFAADSWKAYVDRANAEAATYGISLDALRKASAGLKTDTELLAFAEKSLSKDLALTRKEMETVLRAQVALARNGRDAAKVEEALGAALTKNTVKPLKELGIVLKQNEDPAKNYIQIMKALETAANDAGASQAEVGENVQRAGVMIQNSWTDVKVAAGKLVDEGLSPLAGALTWVFNVINDFLSAGQLTDSDVQTLRRRTGNGTLGEAWAARGQNAQQLSGLGLAQWQGTANATFENFAGIVSDLKVSIAKQQKFEELAAEASAKAALDAAKAAKAAEEAWFALRNAAMEGDEVAKAASWQNQFGEAPRVTGAGGGFQGMAQGSDPSSNLLSSIWGRGSSGPSQSTQIKGRLEQIFGPIEQFDAYATAFQMLEGSVTSALDAWITGSQSAGEAVKSFIAESLRALALEMAVRSLREFATAAAMAASPYTAWEAPGHAKAGAMYGAAAAAAAIGARALGAGGGGGSASGGGGAGGAVSAGAGAASGAGRQTTVIIATGHDFAEDSPRARLNKARQLVRTAQAQAGEGGRFE
jgi:hypothetical protein